MHLSTLLIFTFAVFGATQVQAQQNSSATRTVVNVDEGHVPGSLIFEENFDTLDLSLWRHEINMNGGGNNEFQIYDSKAGNVYVKDGILFLKATQTLDRLDGNIEDLYNGNINLQLCTDRLLEQTIAVACSKQASYPDILPPAQSARLRTKGTFSFRYGRVVVRAKLPAADWTWPAIWMMPEDGSYGGWPSSGEIDIMESRGNRNLYDSNMKHIGSEHVGSTLHFGPNPSNNGYWAATTGTNSAPGNGFDQDFHEYGVEWTKDGLKFSLDGNVTLSVDPPAGGFFELGQFNPAIPNPWVDAENFRMAPFDQKFHFILNVAVGGDYFPSNSIPARPWNGPESFLNFWEAKRSWEASWEGDGAALQIDYIRVYAV